MSTRTSTTCSETISGETFLVKIPEPSSALLLAIHGMGIALLVVRRRNRV
jgi:hypothetical protein